MSDKPRDPLLGFAHLWLRLSMGLAMLCAGALAITFPALLILNEMVLRELADQGMSIDVYPVILTTIALLGVASLLVFYFLRHLTRIVSTVGEGDPFVPINAERLRAMGWLAVAADVILAVVAFVVNLAPRRHGQAEIDLTFTLGGVLLALVLFILSRVFREGTRMREELEGTV